MSIVISGTDGITPLKATNGSAGAPSVTGTDTDTGLFFGTNEVNIATGGTERAKVDSSGRLLVGTSSARTNFYNGAAPILLQVECNGGVGEFSGVRNENNANGATLVLGKSRGTTIGSNTIVQNGDEIGGVFFQGGDGTNLVDCAKVQGFVDGTPGTADMPGRLVFSTTADGASSPTERMRIDSNGAVQIFDNLRPWTDNSVSNGTASRRWSVIYAGTGTINTSDANLKQDIANLEQAELNVAVAIKRLIKKFRFADAVADKGDDARIHVGVIAQEVKQAFIDEGLDPHRYGLFCEDTLEDGSKRLGIRYDELLAFVIAALLEGGAS